MNSNEEFLAGKPLLFERQEWTDPFCEGAQNMLERGAFCKAIRMIDAEFFIMPQSSPLGSMSVGLNEKGTVGNGATESDGDTSRRICLYPCATGHRGKNHEVPAFGDIGADLKSTGKGRPIEFME
jgi:hypothetical protein